MEDRSNHAYSLVRKGFDTCLRALFPDNDVVIEGEQNVRGLILGPPTETITKTKVSRRDQPKNP